MDAAQAEKQEAADYRAVTAFLDHDDPAVRAFAQNICANANSDKAKAIALYYAVRDGIRYDAYRVEFTRDGMRAGRTLEQGFGFCISKAALLAAAGRAVGLETRLGYGDVRNHLTTEKLRERMKTDVFTWHGYTEFRINGRWVKATPAFNRELCEKFGVLPLEFDGETDSLFQPFRPDGGKHMEYLRDRGTYDDIPYDLIHATWAETLPGNAEDLTKGLNGDFAEDGFDERARA